MMVMGWLAGDEGVSARRQVEALYRTELGKDLQRTKDRRAAQTASTAVGIGKQLFRREVAGARGNQARKRAPRRCQAVSGPFEGLDDRCSGNHGPDASSIETQSQ